MDHMTHDQACAAIDAGDAVAYSTPRGWHHCDTFKTTPVRIAEEHRLELAACGVAS